MDTKEEKEFERTNEEKESIRRQRRSVTFACVLGSIIDRDPARLLAFPSHNKRTRNGNIKKKTKEKMEHDKSYLRILSPIHGPLFEAMRHIHSNKESPVEEYFHIYTKHPELSVMLAEVVSFVMRYAQVESGGSNRTIANFNSFGERPAPRYRPAVVAKLQKQRLVTVTAALSGNWKRHERGEYDAYEHPSSSPIQPITPIPQKLVDSIKDMLSTILSPIESVHDNRFDELENVNPFNRMTQQIINERNAAKRQRKEELSTFRLPGTLQREGDAKEVNIKYETEQWFDAKTTHGVKRETKQQGDDNNNNNNNNDGGGGGVTQDEKGGIDEDPTVMMTEEEKAREQFRDIVHELKSTRTPDHIEPDQTIRSLTLTPETQGAIPSQNIFDALHPFMPDNLTEAVEAIQHIERMAIQLTGVRSNQTSSSSTAQRWSLLLMTATPGYWESEHIPDWEILTLIPDQRIAGAILHCYVYARNMLAADEIAAYTHMQSFGSFLIWSEKKSDRAAEVASTIAATLSLWRKINGRRSVSGKEVESSTHLFRNSHQLLMKTIKG